MQGSSVLSIRSGLYGTLQCVDFLNINHLLLFSFIGTVAEEEIIVDNIYVESVFRYRFSRYTYDFRNEVNTTFLFYLSNFTHPFTFRVNISFTLLLIYTLFQRFLAVLCKKRKI